MRVVFSKADLDTCLAGAIAGVTRADAVVWLPGGATPAHLADPQTLCLEAGGSGQAKLRNFDHHNTALPLPPAATQAFLLAGRPPEFERLVQLNELVDTAQAFSNSQFPNASHLISGIRFVHARDPVRQFLAGVEALDRIAREGLDPFGPLPWLPDWQPYLEEKQRRMAQLPLVPGADWVQSNGLNIAFLETDAIGAPALLYRQGADVAVVFSPGFGHPPVPKYTISGNQVRVDRLLPLLNARDPGWGGPSHGTIIGSPRAGSRMAFGELRRLVENSSHLLSRTGAPQYGTTAK